MTYEDNQIKKNKATKICENLVKEEGLGFLIYWIPLITSKIWRKDRKKHQRHSVYLPKWIYKDREHRYSHKPACDYPIFDHMLKVSGKGDEKYTIVESNPYYATMGDFKELIKFCEENGLSFSCHGSSDYFMGNTFRIDIWRMVK